MFKKIITVILLFTLPAFSAGPAKLAKSDRNLWPHNVNTPELFDFASKMEILVYAKHINLMNAMTEAELREYTSLKSVDMDSVKRYSAIIKGILLKNLTAVQHHHKYDWVEKSASTWEELTELSAIQEKKLPERYKAWYENADQFYASYAYEQYRLASLFPRITSEIMKLDEREINGTEYKDKQFILTFDDGPTSTGGYTDAIIAMLNKNGKTAVFFILETSLKQRNNKGISTLYKNMTVGSHGREHKQHTKAEVWQDLSLFNREATALSGVENPKCCFRPPYGQRTLDFINYLDENGCELMLWNIDSQDWQKDMTAEDIADRLTSLMLMWRSGILLFHDVNNKSLTTLPLLWERFDSANISWD